MDRARLWRFVRAVGPVLLYMGLIAFLSGKSDLPRTRISDKLIHAAEYAVLGALIFRALVILGARVKTSTVVLAAGIATFFGITDEVHQMFVPRRDASLLDLVADAVGGGLGASAYAALEALRRRRQA